MIQIEARSWSSLILQRPIRFAAPSVTDTAEPEVLRFWWAQLEAVFPISDPREFAPFSVQVSERDQQVLRRFVLQARQVAESSALNYNSKMVVDVADDGMSETVTADFPAADVLAGFSALFRQLYSTDEKASFKAVSGLMMKLARQEADDDAEARVGELKHWGKAAGRLRGRSIEYLVMEQLAKDGTVPGVSKLITETYPDPESPQQVISTHLYGNHLHWDSEKAAILLKRSESELFDARSKLFFLTSCAALAYLYIGYSVLIDTAVNTR